MPMPPSEPTKQVRVPVQAVRDAEKVAALRSARLGRRVRTPAVYGLAMRALLRREERRAAP